MAYEDIKDIFKNILEFEEQAMKLYSQVFQKTQNSAIRKQMEGLIKDETAHAVNAREALKLLEN